MERFKAGLFVLCAFALAACGGPASHPLSSDGVTPQTVHHHSPSHRPLDGVGSGPGARSLLSILLGDSLPNLGGKQLAHLYVGIDEVDVTTSSGVTAAVASYSAPQVIDVLQYQGTAGASVANSGTTATTYTNVQFILDEGTSQAVFTDGSSMPLTYMTQQRTTSTSGIDGPMTTQADPTTWNAVDVISNRTFTIPANSSANVRVDFNAFESLIYSSGYLYANPVLMVAPYATAGEVTGTVTNSSGYPVKNAVVVAYDQYGNALNTGYTGSTGQFDLTTLNATSAQIIVFNAYTNAAGRTFYSSGSSNSHSYVYGPVVTLQGGTPTNAGTIGD